MSNSKYKNNSTETFFKDSERNLYIKEALKELLYEIAECPIKYTLEQNIVPNTRHFALKEIAYILTISLKDFLNYIKNSDEQIISVYNAKSSLKNFINTELMRLRWEPIFLQNTCEILDKKLNKLYKINEKVSDDPIIQFIYWAVKNIPRLCIDPKKDTLIHEVDDILKDYFNNIFLAISKYNENIMKMSSSEIRNFLSSEFIDLILLSEYYQKTFE